MRDYKGKLETDHEQWRLGFNPEGKRCQLGFSVAGYIGQRAGNGVKVKEIKKQKGKSTLSRSAIFPEAAIQLKPLYHIWRVEEGSSRRERR